MRAKGSQNNTSASAELHLEPSSPKVAKVPIQLKVKAEVARDFRVFCAARDLQLSEVFEKMFAAYQQNN